jgi:hypothetical protein
MLIGLVDAMTGPRMRVGCARELMRLRWIGRRQKPGEVRLRARVANQTEELVILRDRSVWKMAHSLVTLFTLMSRHTTPFLTPPI